MPHVSVQVKVIANTNIDEDAFVNTWHFEVESSPPSSTTLEDIGDELEIFYDSILTACSPSLISGSYELKYYNMEDPPPRRPMLEETRSASGLTAGNSMPPEVCCCVSFQAAPVSGIPQARRRGRIYLPAFKTSQYLANGALSGTIIDSVATIAGTFLAASDAAADWTWCVFSRVNDETYTVSDGWVDDAPDIQRRRGRDATTREVFP